MLGLNLNHREPIVFLYQRHNKIVWWLGGLKSTGKGSRFEPQCQTVDTSVPAHVTKYLWTLSLEKVPSAKTTGGTEQKNNPCF